MNISAGTADLEQIQIKDILGAWWSFRHWILGFTGLCLAATAVALLFVPKKYSASVVISPASQNTSSQSGMLGSLTSNLASLTGITMGSDSKKVESVAVLQSEVLTERYIQQNNLLPVLYADYWDAAKNRWTVTNPSQTPTPWKANEYFKKSVRSVITDPKTGLVTLTISWVDPQQAAQWANGLVKMANEYARDTAIFEAEQNIAYLTDQAAKTDVLGIRQAIYSLLQSEFSRAMLAKGNQEYAFKVIDPATAPERATSPAKLVWLLATLFVCLSLSLFAAVLIVSWRKQ